MKARKRKRRRSGLLGFIFFIFLMVLAGGGLYFLASLPIWEIKEVSVSGTKILSADEIRDLAGVPLLENLFLTDLSRSRNNLRKIAAIKSFSIFRLPPGTILIKINERKPVAVVVLKGKSTIIDETGYILNRNSKLSLNIANLTDLPVISGLGSVEAIEGEKIDAKTARIISEIVLQLSSFLGSRRLQLDLGGFNDISFLLDDVIQIRLGSDEEINRKMTVLKSLLAEIAARWTKVDYIDVRYPDNPVIRYR